MSLPINIEFVEQQHKLQIVLNILKSLDKKFIVIDGVISAGKTTLIKLIENTINSNTDITNSDICYENSVNQLNTLKKLKIKAIFEPVELWTDTGALEYFYKDIDKNCYEFQTYTYITRINSVINEIYNTQDADIYILERSIWTDRYVFMELLKDTVGPLRMAMYNQWCDLWSYILPLRVDKWVFLDTSLNESLRRIHIRNRSSETGISIGYQTQLYNKHIEFYNTLISQDKNVVIIDKTLMNSDFINDKIILNNIITQIIN